LKILIDESLPSALGKRLPMHQAITVQQRGWSGVKNGELLKRASREFEVLLTADKNMQFQQNMKKLDLAIVIFPTNHYKDVMNLVEDLMQVLETIQRGQFIEL
jgi:predicted nuclease of predicted toxin-antitoxin system